MACSSEFRMANSLKSFEENTFGFHVKSYEIISPLSPITNADSCEIVKRGLKSFIREKDSALNKQLSDIDFRIDNTQKKIDSTQNDLMKKAIKFKLEELKNLRKRHLQIIEMYKQNQEQTEISKYTKLIDKYTLNPEKYLGYTARIKVTGKLGELESQTLKKTYLLNTDKNKVLGIWNINK